MKNIQVLALLGILLSMSINLQAQNAKSDAQLRKKADKLAHQFIITDGHVDLPYRLKTINFRPAREYLGIPIKSKEGDFDYTRAKKGGLDAPFMSIYIPSSYQETGGAKELADSLIQMVRSIAESHPDKFAMATSPDQVEKNFKKGIISLSLGMENGAGIEDNLKNLEYFYQKGIRYITLTHAKPNLICDSSYDSERTWNGLSPFGREVVQEMNRLGIMIDISHVSDSTFYQVARLSKAPLIASHSSCRAFTPGFERNMSDDMIRELGKNGGVIQINFGSIFLDGTSNEAYYAKHAELEQMLREKGLAPESKEAQAITTQFEKDNPVLFSDVVKVADHIDHVVKLAGIDHVGLGSDFDGVGDSLPIGLKDVSQYPNLIYELLKRGYQEEDIAKICYKNVFRVWNKVAEIAQN